MLARLAALAVVAVAAPLPALALESPARDSIDALIEAQARANHVPASFVHRVVKRESNYNPGAVGRGGALGLMQIKHATARGLGYKGTAQGLLDARTNLTYAVAYLAGAYRTARGDETQAYSYYAKGYYYAAKRQGIGTQVAEAEAPVAQSTTFATSPFGRFLARGFGLPSQPAQAAPAPVAVASADAAASAVPSIAAEPAAAAMPTSVPLPPARPAALMGTDPFAAAQGGTLGAPDPAPAPATVLAYASPPAPTATAAPAAPAATEAQADPALDVPLPPRRPAALRHFVKKPAAPAAQTAQVAAPAAEPAAAP
jgi:hypothetical protein